MRIIPCPLCGNSAHTTVVSRARRGVIYACVRCNACKFHFVNPEPSPEELAEFYGTEYLDQHTGVWHGFEDEANRAVLRRLKALGVASLVDLGAGQGRFVSMARDFGIDANGVEPVAASIERAREEYGIALNRNSVAGYLGAQPANVECFTMLNVLEHVPAPLEIARSMHRALRPGGRVLAIVPNVDFTLTLGALRGLAGFRDRFMLESPRFTQQGFDPPVHLSSFDARHLRTLFERAGFEVELIRQAPVIRTRSLVMNVAKFGVAAVGRVAEIATMGAVHWGYSLLAVARRAS